MSDVEYATDKTYVDTYIHTAWCRPCMYVSMVFCLVR